MYSIYHIIFPYIAVISDIIDICVINSNILSKSDAEIYVIVK